MTPEERAAARREAIREAGRREGERAAREHPLSPEKAARLRILIFGHPNAAAPADFPAAGAARKRSAGRRRSA